MYKFYFDLTFKNHECLSVQNAVIEAEGFKSAIKEIHSKFRNGEILELFIPADMPEAKEWAGNDIPRILNGKEYRLWSGILPETILDLNL